MAIETRMVDNIAVLDIDGDLTFFEGSEELCDKMRELLAAGQTNILLNTGDLGHVDSSGIGELARSYSMVTKGGGKIKLLNLTKELRELLTVTKLLILFDTYDDEKEAVASFL